MVSDTRRLLSASTHIILVIDSASRFETVMGKTRQFEGYDLQIQSTPELEYTFDQL